MSKFPMKGDSKFLESSLSLFRHLRSRSLLALYMQAQAACKAAFKAACKAGVLSIDEGIGRSSESRLRYLLIDFDWIRLLNDINDTVLPLKVR